MCGYTLTSLFIWGAAVHFTKVSYYKMIFLKTADYVDSQGMLLEA